MAGLEHLFENYANEDGGNVSVPRSFRARPHSEQVNLAYITPQEEGILQTLRPGTPHRGPMEVPNYDSFDAAGGYSNPDTGYSASSGGGGGGWQDTSRADQRVNERAEQVRRNYVNKENIRSSPLHQRYKPNRIGGQSNWQKFNPLRLLGGFFGNVGRIGSGIMGLGSDWASNMRGGMTQREWEEAKQERIANKRIQNILGRKAPITEMTQRNLGKLGYTGEMPGIGSTGTSRAIDKDYTMQDTLREYPITTNRIQDIQRGWNNAGITGTQAYEDFSPNVALSKMVANEEFERDNINKRLGYDTSNIDWSEQDKVVGDKNEIYGGNIEPAAFVKDPVLKAQSWYKAPLKLRQGTLSTALGENAQEKMQAFQELKRLVPQGSLTIEKYLNLAQQNKVPEIIAEDMNEQVLEAIKEQGGFGDMFPKNYSLGNIQPTIKDGRIDIDESKIDDDYRDQLKYLDI